MTAAHLADTVDRSELVLEAQHQFLDAAARSAVEVSLVTDLDQLEAVEALVNDTWRNPTAEISVGMLRALSASGNLVSGAYRGGELLGACVAFVGNERHPHLHSHLAAVRVSQRARGIGFALKLHQRAWALGMGFTSVTWTFDPLVRRNARLNIARLSASPVEYLPDFYGTRDDALNAALPTDRMLVNWDLARESTRAACARQRALPEADALVRGGAHLAVEADGGGQPVRVDDDARIILVGLPEDISRLRRSHPGIAEQWRMTVRQVLTSSFAAGHRIVGFTDEGHYVIDRGGL